MRNFITWLALLTSVSPGELALAGELKTPILFKILAPNGHVSHLFGSFHYGISVRDLPPRVIALFNQSENHVYELKVVPEWDLLRRVRFEPDLMDELLQRSGIDPKTPGEFSEVEVQQLVHLGIPIPVARKMRDDQCQMFVFRKYFFGPEPAKSLDGEFQLETLRSGHRLIELESDAIRDQAREEANTQGYDDSCHVRDRLTNPAVRTAEDNEIELRLNQYRSYGPADILADHSEDSDPATAIRNRVWMKTLPSLLNASTAFIVVGMYHLNGPNGLIQLLRQAGFTVDPE